MLGTLDDCDTADPGNNVVTMPLTRDERERAVARAMICPMGPVTVIEIARRLAINTCPRRSILDQIRLLHRSYGFPAPANPRFENGVRITGERAIVWKSRWARDLVETWFGHDDTPANAALASAASQQRTRAALAANAQRLAGGAG